MKKFGKNPFVFREQHTVLQHTELPFTVGKLVNHGSASCVIQCKVLAWMYRRSQVTPKSSTVITTDVTIFLHHTDVFLFS